MMQYDKSQILPDIESYQTDRGGAHCAGTLTGGPLKTIEWYLREYFQGRPIRIIETGCGASTILMSQYAEKLYTFCYDDRAANNSSVAFAEEFPQFRKEHVEWVFGPTQITVPKYSICDPVDMILIDGPHGFPFPELEFYHFYQLLRADSVLIIDDIHIPSIRNLFDFLCQDEMFYLHQVTMTTAFFVRSKSPMLNPTGDDWWLQGYNVQKFPAWAARVHNPRFPLPLSLSLNGNSTNLEHFSPRGVIIVDGRLTTAGSVSWLRVPIEHKNDCDLQVEVLIEFVAPEQRPNAGFEFLVNNSIAEVVKPQAARQLRISGVAKHRADMQYVEIKFHNFGLKHADQIEGFPSAHFDRRLPNAFIDMISVRRTAQKSGQTLKLHAGQISEFGFRNQAIRFFIDNPLDSIQSFHSIGHFYEEEELSIIERYVKTGSSIIDVGANIGNHLVYFAKLMGAAQMVAVEPCQKAVKLLKLNLQLNGISNVDVSHLGVALGEKASRASLRTLDSINQGGTQFIFDEDGPVDVKVGDDLFINRRCDFIKIDVEGQELNVLRGLNQTINKWSPVVFVEVVDENRQDVLDFMKALDYSNREEYARYEGITNFLFKRSKMPTRLRRWRALLKYFRFKI